MTTDVAIFMVFVAIGAVALVKPSWFEDHLRKPSRWDLAGRWTSQHPIVAVRLFATLMIVIAASGIIHEVRS